MRRNSTGVYVNRPHKHLTLASLIATVLHDLAILEQQQLESQRQLVQTKRIKQHALEQLLGFEHQLQHLQYTNGQDSSLLARRHDQMSQGQRALCSSKNEAADAKRDLNEFDKHLQTAQHSNRAVLHTERRCRNCLHHTQIKTKSIVQLRQQLKEKIVAVQEESSRRLKQELDMSSKVQRSEATLKSIQEQLTHVQAGNTTIEQQIAKHQAGVHSKQDLHTGMEKQSANDDKRHGENMSKLDTDAKLGAEREKSITDDLQTKVENALQDQEALRASWKLMTVTQEAEGHEIRKTEPPFIDLERIRESSDLGAKVADGVASKQEMEGSIAAKLQQLLSSKAKLGPLNQLAQSVEVQNETDRDVQASRKQQMTELLTKVEADKAEYEKSNASIPALQDHREAELKEFRNQLDAVMQGIQHFKSELGRTKKQIVGAENSTKCVQVQQQETIEEAGISKDDIEAAVVMAQESFNGLEVQKQRVVLTPGLDWREADLKISKKVSNEDMKAEIQALLDSTYLMPRTSSTVIQSIQSHAPILSFFLQSILRSMKSRLCWISLKTPIIKLPNVFACSVRIARSAWIQP